MKSKLISIILTISLFILAGQASGQMSRKKTDANIFGHVVSNGKHIPYATVTVKGTTIGTATDRTGHYRLTNLPEGEIELLASCLGYRNQTKTVTMVAGVTQEVNFDLEVDLLHVDEVVITGDRNAINRREASSIISVVNPKIMSITSAASLSEGLPFIPGVRMENNCQNCGFNSVRLNGMTGEYSQILVDGHPIFSGLMGVYGMEVFPASMIERIEVLRGGGSALYGGNAVAGTINLILQDPMGSSFEAGYFTNFIGAGIKDAGPMKLDHNISLNASVVSDDNRAGLAVYGGHRYRNPYDYNKDEFSELAMLRNTMLGARAFHRLGNRGKLTATYFHISEERRGGDQIELPKHVAEVAEAPDHHINSLSLGYTQLFREQDALSINASMMHIDRDSYYGANTLEDYGKTKDLTYNFGAQYSAKWDWSSLIGGVDLTGEQLVDKKHPYPDFANAPINAGAVDMDNIPLADEIMIADQTSLTAGAFLQYNARLGIASLTAGLRGDYYTVTDRTGYAEKNKGFVPVPRVSVLLHLLPSLQLRTNYSMGYRVPQVYNEDLHVECSAAKRIIHRSSKDLQRETSHSGMLSLDYNEQLGSIALGVLVEGFYTRLNNAFINVMDDSNKDITGEVIMERLNSADGAHIFGANFELNLAPLRTLSFKLGGTVQKSEYLKEPVEELNFGLKEFVRTPNAYGFLMGEWNAWRNLSFSATLNITGPMSIPYEGFQNLSPAEEAQVDAGELVIRRSQTFADLGLQAGYDFQLKGAILNVFGGVKNAFNSFQKDFDSGAEREPGYTYGPMLPRTLYVGIKLQNIF